MFFTNVLRFVIEILCFVWILFMFFWLLRVYCVLGFVFGFRILVFIKGLGIEVEVLVFFRN